MNLEINLNTIIEAAIAGILVWVGKTQLLNYKKLAELAIWTTTHDKQDDERHIDLVKRLERVEEK